MHNLGKGYFIWNIAETEGGDPNSIARAAREAGLGHVLIKITDGTYAVNNVPSLPLVIDALRAEGVEVLGWGYVYGDYPEKEANIAISRMIELGLTWFVIDAESQYKNKTSQAVTYTNRLRAALPNVTLALSSYRWPSLHREFPWKEFLSRVNVNMPQVYWVNAKDAGAQLRRSVKEFKEFPERPIIPTGAAYVDNFNVDPTTKAYWRPTVDQVREFMATATELGLGGFNFWVWEHAKKFLPETWEAIAEFGLPAVDPEEPEPVPNEPDPEPEPETYPVRIAKPTSEVNSWLNIRSKPSTNYSIVGKVLPSEDVFVLEEEIAADGSTWVRVGHHQWAAMRWKNPATGLFVQFLEYS